VALRQLEGVMTMAENEKRFSLRIPEDLHADLSTMAKEQSRSLHNLIIVILREAVARWKKEREATTQAGSPL
jgi:predicted HicB family RNase H-like nuclease